MTILTLILAVVVGFNEIGIYICQKRNIDDDLFRIIKLCVIFMTLGCNFAAFILS
ncbi:hypothetical protein [Ruminiclostridium cellulolyticum]|uniref:Uncharacterized protein n=1 Tax=Ruminiclostridium cellulolyticum (strain ATCC 35319 / DSM 5812 / JCM 6584 / H10) TaxID=394503 RepID=B8I102_RUMCH|nr:hypothetical protein [Ruminiclostridium cellulolyticum]ACL77558.1 hypothetical protein Ccel_3269 [Ruminiclostridium cellulolyticum H10]